MTQAELVAHLADKFDIKRAQAKGILDELAAVTASEVKSNGEFTLPGIGKVVTAHREARAGRNPATGKAITIAASTVVKVRIAKALKDAVAGK
jgi:DNA-binding protein HU-beta